VKLNNEEKYHIRSLIWHELGKIGSPFVLYKHTQEVLLGILDKLHGDDSQYGGNDMDPRLRTGEVVKTRDGDNPRVRPLLENDHSSTPKVKTDD